MALVHKEGGYGPRPYICETFFICNPFLLFFRRRAAICKETIRWKECKNKSITQYSAGKADTKTEQKSGGEMRKIKRVRKKKKEKEKHLLQNLE